MRLSSLVSSISVTSSVAALQTCGTRSPTPQQLQQIQALQLHSHSGGISHALNLETPINIDVFYHVILDKHPTSLENALALIQSQTDVLNDAFRPHNISFTHVNSTWHARPEWSSNQQELAMRIGQRLGTYADLNMYVHSQVGWHGDDNETQIVSGLATLPKETSSHTLRFYGDGVAIGWETLPGNDPSGWSNGGKTAVHEAGHWLGLYHTFEGGCGTVGDGISDTPAQAEPNDACDLNKDSCPEQPGKDPVSNYMNYTPDSCQVEFTPGQAAAMHANWIQYRQPHKLA